MKVIDFFKELFGLGKGSKNKKRKPSRASKKTSKSKSDIRKIYKTTDF